MKLLSKLSSKKSRIPVLNTIFVQTGTAQATDMDMIISCQTDKPDGLYNGKAPELKSDLAPDTFPILEIKGEIIGTVPSDLNTLETIAPAMSDEETRYYLCGMAIIPQGYICATNGHIAILKPCAGLPGTVIMPREFIEYCMAACKEGKIKDFDFEFFPYHVRAVIGKYTIVSKLIDGTYPDILRVVPDRAKMRHAGWLSQGEAKIIHKEARRICKAVNGAKSLPIAINGSGKAKHEGIEYPMTLSFDTERGFSAPYIAAMPSGDWYYSSARDPHRIEAGEYIGVIMPMRV